MDIKNMMIRLMQLGVGITALVGVSMSLSGVPIVGPTFEWIASQLSSILTWNVIGPALGIAGGLGMFFGLVWLGTGQDLWGLGSGAFSPGAGLREVTGTVKGVVGSI